MASPVAAPSAGLPPGVEAGDLLKRFLAHVIDSIVPAVVIGICSGIAAAMDPGAGAVILTLIGILAAVGWFVFTWWMFATRAAGPGMRLMHLQLVGLADGRPIGWMRYLLRSLVLGVLMGTGLGAILLIVFLVMHPRHQGWHDLVANSVVIAERTLAPTQAPQQAVDQGRSQQAAQAAPQFQQSAPQFQQSAPQQGAPAAYGPQASPYRQQFADSATGALPPAGQPGQPQPEPGVSQDSAADPVQPQQASADPYGRPPAPESAASAQSQGSAPDRMGRPIPPQGQVHAPAPVTAPPPPVSPSAPISYPSAGVAGAGVAGAGGVAAGAAAGAVAGGAGSAQSSGTANAGPPIPPDGRPLDQGWGIQLDDGRKIAIEGLALLGRNPQPRDGEQGANLIKFADDTRTVSKTHLAIGVDANGPYVMDRGSTNGSSITNEFGVTLPCRAGDVVQVKNGLVVSFGDHWLKFTRTDQ